MVSRFRARILPALAVSLRPVSTACVGFALFAPTLVGQIVPQPAPPGNPAPVDPLTDPRVLLGHILFFEEQVSATRTVACATCHLPEAGGTDPRAQVFHPGSPTTTEDDAEGSAGVILNVETGNYVASPVFGLDPQGTRRKAPSFLNGSVFEELFWDGSAQGEFLDESSMVVTGLETGAALESQAVVPPVSSVEMAHMGSDWSKVVARLESVTPLALASSIPPRLVAFIDANGGSYSAMFDAAFLPSTVAGQTAPGPGVTRRRFAMAVATYQRTLLSQEAPVLVFGGLGGPQSLAAWGGFLFEGNPSAGRADCSRCHKDKDDPDGMPHSRKTDNLFHNTGLVPPSVDAGRFNVTGNEADRGKFKTPSLFNVALQNQFFHNGSLKSLEEVIDFYIQGGDPDIPGNELVPLQLINREGVVDNEFGKDALIAYLQKFTDPRLQVPVSQLQPPFDRPTLYTESNWVPVSIGPGTGGEPVPAAIAIEPPLSGNPNFTLGVKNGRGGFPAYLWIDVDSISGGEPLHGTGPTIYLAQTAQMIVLSAGALNGDGIGNGYTSLNLDLGSPPAVVGATRYAQWVLVDPLGPNGLTASNAVEYTFF
jgi:cytochrome c peroxidase